MATPASIFKKIRRICLGFPDAVETETQGKPHFRIDNKIFAGCGEEDGNLIMGFKLEMRHAKEIIKAPEFSKVPHVGHEGWVSMNASEIIDWELVSELIDESYRLIAPNTLVGMLDSETESAKSTKKQPPGKIRKKK